MFAPLDVYLDECWNAKPLDQSIERHCIDLDSLIPLHAAEIRISCPRSTPVGRKRRHCRGPLADGQRSASGRVRHSRLDNAYVRRAAEQCAQQPCEIRLRLDRYYTTTERRKRADAVAGVRPDVEHEIARCDETAVQSLETPLPEGDGVIDGQRTREAQGPVEAAQCALITSEWLAAW